MKGLRLMVLLVAAPLLLAACGTPSAALMAPLELRFEAKFEGPATVSVSGSNENLVKNADIQAAVSSALAGSGLFGGGEDKFRVTLSVLSIENPMFGLDLESKLRIRWRLTNASTGAELWTETISSSHVAKLGDHLIAAERIKLANAGSIKANITQAISKMASLNAGPK